MDSKLNIGEQCAATAERASKMIVCINKDIISRDKEDLIPLYSALIMSHLKYCV